MSRVLVVDDDPTVTDVVSAYLQGAGYVAITAGDGAAALRADERDRPDLIVLDLMMPGVDGLEVARRVRKRRPDVPIIMLTALGEEADRIAGLEAGADDYVVKPFSPRELMLRIQSVLRRSQPEPPTDTRRLVDGDLELDPVSRTAERAGRPLGLTAREFDLLAHFLRHPGRAFSREDLLSGVWGWDFGDHSTVTVHVRRLREKVEDEPGSPARLVTVWGTGYRWDPTP